MGEVYRHYKGGLYVIVAKHCVQVFEPAPAVEWLGVDFQNAESPGIFVELGMMMPAYVVFKVKDAAFKMSGDWFAYQSIQTGARWIRPRYMLTEVLSCRTYRFQKLF